MSNKMQKKPKSAHTETNGKAAVTEETRKLFPRSTSEGAIADASTERLPLVTSLEQLRVVSSPPAENATAAKGEENSTPSTQPKTKVTADNQTAATVTKAPLSKSARQRQKRRAALHNKHVAIDCEMVGVGTGGQRDMLARVSLVNKAGEVLLDKYVKPQEQVVDYRTSVSGIRPLDIENGEDFERVQDEVVSLLQGKILIGHGLKSDMAVLHIKHPFMNIRDTARYKPLRRLVANGHTPSLKRLSMVILGLEIQTGEHNSIEDARAAMSIYNYFSEDWELQMQAYLHKNYNQHK